MLFPQNDIHQGCDVGDGDALVEVDIGCRVVVLPCGVLAQDYVDQGCNVSNRDAAVSVDVATQEGRLCREVAGVIRGIRMGKGYIGYLPLLHSCIVAASEPVALGEHFIAVRDARVPIVVAIDGFQ